MDFITIKRMGGVIPKVKLKRGLKFLVKFISFNSDKIQVLDSSAYNIDLETKESLYISYLKPSLNTDTKSRPLLLF